MPMKSAPTNRSIEKSAEKRKQMAGYLILLQVAPIGAINSTVLVGHYMKNNNSWEGSAEKLLEFWEGLMCPTIADDLFETDSFFRSSWDYMHAVDSGIADAESARTFWSIFEFAFTPRRVKHMRNISEMGFQVPQPLYRFLAVVAI